MSMTMTQKILAAHAGLQEVNAGDLIEAKLDLVLGNDITAPVAIRVFEQTGFKTVFDPERIAIVLDHYTPCKDIKSAELCQISRNFARKHGILHFYDVGQAGIEHALLPEKGLVAPGECVIGADSHTCTYGALGAFSTGVGSTDMAAGIAAGENWFKVPAAIKVTLEGSLPKHVSGKDVILHLIGMIGVDGALYRSLEFTGDGVSSLPKTASSRWMKRRLPMCPAGFPGRIRSMKQIRTQPMRGKWSSTCPLSGRPFPCRICPATPKPLIRSKVSPSIRS